MTPEREEHLRKEWPGIRPWREIATELERMAGGSVSKSLIFEWARNIGIRRGSLRGARKQNDYDGDYSIFTQSCRWEDACDDAGLQFTDAPGLEHGDPAPPRVTLPQIHGPVTRGEVAAHRMAMAIVDTARMGIGRVAA